MHEEKDVICHLLFQSSCIISLDLSFIKSPKNCNQSEIFAKLEWTLNKTVLFCHQFHTTQLWHHQLKIIQELVPIQVILLQKLLTFQLLGRECVRMVARATLVFQVLFHKTSSPKALKPLSSQTHKPKSPQTLKPSNEAREDLFCRFGESHCDLFCLKK